MSVPTLADRLRGKLHEITRLWLPPALKDEARKAIADLEAEARRKALAEALADCEDVARQVTEQADEQMAEAAEICARRIRTRMSA
jgi:hypothetical protein